MTGKTCVITGPTQGIGRATAHALAARGARRLLLCRSEEKGRQLAAELDGHGGVEVVVADLARLQSVAAAAAQVLELAPRVDVLINNAGVVNNRRRETVDGLEEMFAVNYLAHFLLTTRLLPALQGAAPARVVHVGSGAHAMVRGFDFDDYNWQRRRYRTFPAYGHSKLANLLFNRALARRLAGTGVTSNTLHPGAVATGMGSNNGALGKLAMTLLKPFFLTPEQGARTSVYLATDSAAAAHNGEYFIKCKPVRPRPWAEDDAAAERLWSLSETLLRERQLAV
jgi:NAD(P)-dependent dehydrogenase (short-subunit alcohol dehydrogenase family)